jgi:transcriptional antiterminator RfaH
MFVYLDLDKVGMSTFQWMPHALGLVCFGGVPASVPEGLIHEIRERLSAVSTGGGQTMASLRHGDIVQIQNGPFAGYKAIFDHRLSGEERVRVLLQAINTNEIRVDLPAGHVQRIG